MLKHRTNTRTRYEYTIANGDKVVFTLWFMTRRPSLKKIFKLIMNNLDEIKEATGSKNIEWNGDGTITAGEYTGKMTGKTLLEARGRYNQ